MKKLVFLIAITLVACKEKNAPTTTQETPKKTILEEIASAHGFDKWQDVNSIEFTFNVDRDSNHFERRWTWEPKLSKVTMFSGDQTVSYTRKSTVDSTLQRADGAFINDKYWLLAPFNLIWDQENFTYQHEKDAMAPIRAVPMQRLTIVYGAEGGYTPGDAYDFYFEDDFVIKEWGFRKGNAAEAGLVTSWEDYETFNGLKIAKTHRRSEGDWTLYFSDIKVE